MIKYIKIENFKSIISARIDFPKFGVIIGQNGVGKTNLLHALKYLKIMAGGKSTKEAQEKISLVPSEVFNLNIKDKTQRFEVGLINDEEELYIYKVTLHLDEGTKAQSITVESESLVLKTTNFEEKIFYRERDHIRDMNNKEIPLIIEKSQLALAVYKNPKVKELLELFWKIVVTDINYGEVNHPFASIEGFSLPALIVKLKTEYPDKFKQFTTIVSKMLPNFTSITEFSAQTTPKNQEKIYLVLLEEKNINALLSTMSISAGDLKTLYIMALAVGISNNSTLMIDEVENSFHPERVRDLMDRLQNISSINNTQIIFTSHSPTVINSVKPTDIIFVGKSSDRGTFYEGLKDSAEVTKIEDILKNGSTNYEVFSNYWT